MKKKSKLALAPLALGSAATFIGGLFFYRNFIRRAEPSALRPELQTFANQLSSQYTEEIWGFTSFDGLQLKAHFFTGQPESHRYALLVHGYHDTAYRVAAHALHFLEKGYHVLMPDLRGHGLSEGSYVGFGYHDHYDILGYIDLIREHDPEAQIVLMGISMGAATVMLTSGEFLPDNVKCIIEDCGYSSAWEQCRHNMRTIYHLPAFPVLTLTNLILKCKHHYSFKEAAPVKAVAKATVPMLFIHGSKDDFVPFAMQQQLYDACSSTEKELLIVEDAVHANSNEVAPALYWHTVDAFTEKYI